MNEELVEAFEKMALERGMDLSFSEWNDKYLDEETERFYQEFINNALPSQADDQ